MDTRKFNSLTSTEYKKQTRLHWGGHPCGSNDSDKESLSRDYFEEIEHRRYESHPWILRAIECFDLRGKRVLELGYGMGTDHLQLARRGGQMYGLDLTPASGQVTKRRFELYGFHSELMIGDAEHLPYRDGEFDFVYSFGVVHHSPDTERIIREIHRVLKPGGKCWITVYHKNSLFFWWTVYLHDWILKGGFCRETLKERISRIEYPNDNPHLVIKLYRKKEFAEMFQPFKEVRSTIDHLIHTDLALVGRFIPKGFLDLLGKRVGWYIVMEGTK